MTVWGVHNFDRSDMNNLEVRDHVNLELKKRGYSNPYEISNKEACKILGLMPEDAVGIGSGKGRILLKAWMMGSPIPYEALGGMLRELRQQPEQKPIQRIEKKPKRQSKKVIRAKRKYTQSFYDSDAWMELRYKALKACGASCQCCGRSAKDGVVLHVDHIKPRSKFPHLELLLENLQVLCADCNLGKSNKDSTDWRRLEIAA